EDQRSAFILNSEILAEQEYISFGVAECEFLTCVRDADFPPNDDEPGSPAFGYCSAPCIPQEDGSSADGECVPADAADEDPESPKHLTCRSISVDADLLAHYRETDPEG